MAFKLAIISIFDPPISPLPHGRCQAVVGRQTKGAGHERRKHILPTMIVVTKPESSAKRRAWDFWRHLSEAVRNHYNTLLAIVLFFIAQILTCAWDQPFWAAGLDFPGQVIAMLFIWLVMWASQVLFCRAGEGIERFYYQYLRGPVSLTSLDSGAVLPQIPSSHLWC